MLVEAILILFLIYKHETTKDNIYIPFHKTENYFQRVRL